MTDSKFPPSTELKIKRPLNAVMGTYLVSVLFLSCGW